MMQSLVKSDFDFEVPEHLIAQSPLAERGQSRLLIAKGADILHERFSKIADLIPPKSLFIMNQSRVIPARIFAETIQGGRLEIFLLERLASDDAPTYNRWRALGKPMKKMRPGNEIILPGNLRGSIREQNESSAGAWVVLDIPLDNQAFETWLQKYGSIPLPPYIKRSGSNPEQDRIDRQRYQTVYAKIAGSVAAPTAGLHFNETILESLKNHGHSIEYVTLHVGAGTFLPVKTEDLSQHSMHSERYSVSASCLQAIQLAQSRRLPIILVGTTTLRTLESFFLRFTNAEQQEDHCDRWLDTELFIYPQKKTDRYKPQIGDAILTNFHQPCSTLFMLICALIGFEQARQVYKEAIQNEYRLFSYGDASLLWF